MHSHRPADSRVFLGAHIEETVVAALDQLAAEMQAVTRARVTRSAALRHVLNAFFTARAGNPASPFGPGECGEDFATGCKPQVRHRARPQPAPQGE